MSAAAPTRGAALTAGSAPAADADSPGAQWRRRWRALAPRERSAVRAVLWLVGALAVWLIAVQPAWRTLREAPLQLAQGEAQLQRMQRLADEAKGLRGASPVSSSQAAAALRAATERLGGGARLTIQGERATLILPAAAGGAGFGNPGGGAFGNAAGGPAGSAGTSVAVGAAVGNVGSPAAGTVGSATAGGVSGDALRGWLSEARSAARARPVDVQLTRGSGGFSGSLVVLIGPGSGGNPGSAP